MRKFVILKYYSNNLTFRKDLKSGFKIKSFKIKVCFDLSDSVSNFQTRDNKSLKKKNFCSLWKDRFDDIGVSYKTPYCSVTLGQISAPDQVLHSNMIQYETNIRFRIRYPLDRSSRRTVRPQSDHKSFFPLYIMLFVI